MDAKGQAIAECINRLDLLFQLVALIGQHMQHRAKDLAPQHLDSRNFAGRGRLEFVYYELEEPKYDVEECIQRGMTYAAPLKVVLRLIVWDVDEDTGAARSATSRNSPFTWATCR